MNPVFLLLHLKTHLTDEMAEKYDRSHAAEAPQWLQPLFDYQTISDIHLMRHRVRFRTYKTGYDWQAFIKFVKGALASSTLWNLSWQPLTPDEPRRVYAAPEPFDSLVVVEGFAQSRGNPFMARLFDIEGIIELKGQGQRLTVKRSPIYSWAEIEAGYPSAFGAPERAL